MRAIEEEGVALTEYRGQADARRQLGRFLDAVYDRKRIHPALGHLTPAEVGGGGGGGAEGGGPGAGVVPAERAVELAEVDGQDGGVQRMPPGERDGLPPR